MDEVAGGHGFGRTDLAQAHRAECRHLVAIDDGGDESGRLVLGEDGLERGRKIHGRRRGLRCGGER